MHYFCTGIIQKRKKEIEKTDFIFYNSIFSQNIILFIGKEYLRKKRKYETKKRKKSSCIQQAMKVLHYISMLRR